ncbi:MAG TPA: protein-arginine deiminase family protein [Gemmatimonadaceae bacterium]|nr:protein-arginine deiminase family protein [Gemmatimonadaceae bacterium]
MPAYLTHAAVVIKMAEWLEMLRAQIEVRRTRFAAIGQPMTSLDERLYYLAGQTLHFLREDPAAAADVALPVTEIKNGIGTRLSKYALVGSLGPDLPAAGYVLAMNQDWAWHTLHNGEPRRAKKNARTTTFILKLLEVAEKDEKDGRLTAAQRRRVVSYALGHLSHVAADVLLHPAVHHLTWDKKRGALDPLEHKLFEVAIDARLAQGFYNRDDLYDDIQSWTDYYLDKGDFKEDLKLLTRELNGAFKATFGEDRPNAPVCGLADSTKCGAPKFDSDFLMDAYSNTTNWAIDAGYDHGPAGMDVIWTLTILTGAILSVNSLAGSTEKFSTLFNIPEDQITELTNEQAPEWQQEGTASIDVWRDIIDTSLGWADKVALPYEWLLGGSFPLRLITFNQAPDGFFGQDEGVEDSNPAIRTVNDVVWGLKTFGFIILDELAPKFTEQDWWSWLWFVVDNAHDLIEHFALQYESRKENYSEDRLGNATWAPKKILGTSYFVANALTMLWKSTRTNTDGTRAKGVEAEDFIFPLIFANVIAGVFVWSGMWRDHLLFKTTKSRWPSSDVKPVEQLLPVHTVGGRKQFDAVSAQKFSVRLFADDKLTAEGTEAYYPDGGGGPSDVDGQRERDLAARKALLAELPSHEYTLPELLDHAARFAGLLGMAAIAYNETAAPVRPHMTEIFKDWNLDFSTVDQWKELLEPGIADDMGVLYAANLYAVDLEQQAAAPNLSAIGRLRAALGLTDVAGGLIADFTHEGFLIDAVDAETSRALRLTRPGAVVLPNLDVDTPPASPLPSPLPVRTGDLDALKNDTINPLGNDLAELTEFRIRKPSSAGSPHTVVLRLHALDASRVRVFMKDAGTSDTWPVVLGFTTAGNKTEFEIPAAAPNETDYVIELKGFAGDPGLPAPTGSGPLSPAPFGTAGASVGAPVVPERREAEVWIEVIHKDGATEVPGIRDLGLFGVAPLLLLDNMKKAERLYAVFVPDQFDGAGNLLLPGNFPFVSDLARALRSDAGIAPKVTFRTTPAVSGTLDDFVPHQPVKAGDPDEASAFYIVDGMTYGHLARKRVASDPDLFLYDPWVQDEFEICYVHAPRSWMHVVLHNPRKRELADFVEKELPAVDVGLFNGVSSDSDSISYGGNFEVSPPVPVATLAQPRGAAGAEVLAQPVSPLGKVLLGEGTPFLFDIAERFGAELQARTISADLKSEMNGHNFFISTSDTVDIRVGDREWLITTPAMGQSLLVKREPGKLKVHLARLATKEFKHFLEAQRAQPIVTVDTSWLAVGHVDEVFIFVPAPSGGGKSFRLLMASSKLALDIFQEAQFLNAADPVAHPLTKTFRGRNWLRPRPGRATTTAAETVAQTLTTHGTFNRELQIRRLTPMEDRLKATLGLDAADVIRVPVLYDVIPTAFLDQMGARVLDATTANGVRDLTTAAYSPGVVNLQLVDNLALVPKPHGPRMKPDDVVKVMDKVGLPGLAVGDLPAPGSEQWVRVGTTASALAATFGSSAAAIKGDPRNAGKFTGGGAVKLNWDRIFIPENTVDLLEAHVHVQLTKLGLKVHFIEDWDDYHIMEGEVHCGTNVRRTPIEADVTYRGPKWWDCESVKN